IRNDNLVAGLGQSPSHFTHGRSEAEGVGPQQHSGMRAALRMNERGVARSVGHLDFDIGLYDVGLFGRSRPRGRDNRGARGESDEIAPAEFLDLLALWHGWLLVQEDKP